MMDEKIASEELGLLKALRNAECEACALTAEGVALEWEERNEFGRYDQEVAVCRNIVALIRARK